VKVIWTLFLGHMALASMANALPHPSEAEAGDDTLSLQESDKSTARLLYSNSGGMSSNNFNGHMEITTKDGVRVVLKVSVEIGGKSVDHAEILKVEVVEPESYVAIPSDAYVQDGEVQIVEILPPMF